MWSRSKPPDKPANPVGNLGGDILPDRFTTEPLTGYRSWKVVPTMDGQLGLQSLHVHHIWGNPETAMCVTSAAWGRKHEGYAPHPECSCGLYAQHPDHSFKEWEAMRNGKVSVFGTVEMWGRVIICERGYKAQHARIHSGYFEVSCAKGHCDAPVTRVQPRDVTADVLCWCADHDPTSSDHPLVDSRVWLENAAKVLEGVYGVRFFVF